MPAHAPEYEPAIRRGHELFFSELFDFFGRHPRLFPTVWLLVGVGFWALVIWWRKRRLDSERSVVAGFPLALIVKAAFFYEVISFAYQRVELGFNGIGPLTWLHLSTATGALVLLFVGLRDDNRPVRGRIKLGVILVAWAMKFIVIAVFTPYRPISTSEIAILLLFTGLCIAGSIGFPLWDGLNGLFPMLAGFLCLNFGYESVQFLWYDKSHWLGSDWFYAGGAFAGLAGLWLIAFLPWNFPRATSRLAEQAVLPLSFLMCAWVFDNHVQDYSSQHRAFADHIAIDPVWPLSHLLPRFILCLIVSDLTLVIFNRRRHGRSPFTAGHDHLHHRLLQLGYSKVKVTLLMTLPFIPLIPLADLLPQFRVVFQSLQPIQLIVVVAFYLSHFTQAYTKVDPYKSGAVDERGRP